MSESLYHKVLKGLRKAYINYSGNENEKYNCEQDPEVAYQLIYDALISNKPCMIARFGSTELSCLTNYLGIHYQKSKILSYIRGNAFPWWWQPKILDQMHQWSGFFPTSIEKIEQFCELMLQDIRLVDILGSWLPQEKFFTRELKSAHMVNFELLNPYFSQMPWTRALKGKKVLVIHPFANTIQKQFKKRHLIFQNDVLPDFDLITIKAVQSLAGNPTSFNDWFEALEYMKSEIDKVEYDICLIGAGAYGFPLAAHVKRRGKKGFHLGGSLQLLFGIKGKRWANENYSKNFNYSKLMNSYWVTATDDEKPINAGNVEGACYW